ncbi:MAG: ABC transporter ATP-binding protein [Actinomycetota bacterium]
MNEVLVASDTPGAPIMLTGVSMEYPTSAGRVQALVDVTLTVGSGTSTAIVGPSGCGKSTLLGIIGGLEIPTTGEVRVGDDIVSSMSDQDRGAMRRRAFGFVFQADNLQPFLTVNENVGLQSLLAGLPDEDAQRQAMLDALEIGSFGHRFPDQLSGGQRQRVAVARALVHGPRVALADEPTGSLDTASSDKVVLSLLRLHEQKGTTLVVVTHDRSVAERMDVVIEMRSGRITGTSAVSS